MEDRSSAGPERDRAAGALAGRRVRPLGHQAVRAVRPRGGRDPGGRAHVRRQRRRTASRSSRWTRAAEADPDRAERDDRPDRTSLDADAGERRVPAATPWSGRWTAAGRSSRPCCGGRPSARRRRCWARRASCMEMSVEYAKVREQFGQPIGSFQAIKHACAEMLVEVENAHAATYYAAWALDAAAPDAGAGGLGGEVVRRRGVAQGLRLVDPGPRRHRLHLGVRPAPLLQAGQAPGAAVRRRRVPPRAGAAAAAATPSHSTREAVLV